MKRFRPSEQWSERPTGPEGPYAFEDLLASLEDDCRQVIASAEDDAREIRRAAELYRVRVISDAHREAESVIEAARTERDAVLRGASDEISRWLEEFELECRRLARRTREPDPGAG